MKHGLKGFTSLKDILTFSLYPQRRAIIQLTWYNCLWTELLLYIDLYNLPDSVVYLVRVSALSLGIRWFEPWLSHTKHFKSARAASLLDSQHLQARTRTNNSGKAITAHASIGVLITYVQVPRKGTCILLVLHYYYYYYYYFIIMTFLLWQQ